jgi:hypothetical protein
MIEAKKNLTALGHDVLLPIKGGLDIMSKTELKIEHIKKINKSDAIFVINITNNNIKNRIGESTFLEIKAAHDKKKKFFS